jgi:quinol monooxygenase YgiN
MTALRHYAMHAAPGRGPELATALGDLAARLRDQPGCEAIEIWADMADGDGYVFVERWHSPADRDAAGKALGRQAFAPVVSSLAEPPVIRDLRVIDL